MTERNRPPHCSAPRQQTATTRAAGPVPGHEARGARTTRCAPRGCQKRPAARLPLPGSLPETQRGTTRLAKEDKAAVFAPDVTEHVGQR